MQIDNVRPGRRLTLDTVSEARVLVMDGSEGEGGDEGEEGVKERVHGDETSVREPRRGASSLTQVEQVADLLTDEAGPGSKGARAQPPASTSEAS